MDPGICAGVFARGVRWGVVLLQIVQDADVAAVQRDTIRHQVPAEKVFAFGEEHPDRLRLLDLVSKLAGIAPPRRVICFTSAPFSRVT